MCSFSLKTWLKSWPVLYAECCITWRQLWAGGSEIKCCDAQHPVLACAGVTAWCVWATCGECHSVVLLQQYRPAQYCRSSNNQQKIFKNYSSQIFFFFFFRILNLQKWRAFNTAKHSNMRTWSLARILCLSVQECKDHSLRKLCHF